MQLPAFQLSKELSQIFQLSKGELSIQLKNELYMQLYNQIDSELYRQLYNQIDWQLYKRIH